MSRNEAEARIKINKLLEESGWRFFDDETDAANIRLEVHTKITQADLDRLGDDFDGTGENDGGSKTGSGKVDFLLLDSNSYPFIVLEAKSESIEPLAGKEQARKYAHSLNCRFVILSNGNIHYFWDLKRGSPHQITSFPDPKSVEGYKRSEPDSKRLTRELVNEDYIVLTQHPQYAKEASWLNEHERPNFVSKNNLRFLRPYQLRAIHALQKSVKAGNDRFLFEMATGTGKTLVATAIIKLFLKTANSRRVLFLVDRLELENQALRVFNDLLSKDFTTVIFKENKDDWQKAEIVVATTQSLLFNNKFQELFSPTDFDFVISDESHRSINGNARSVFEYFVGYKLGLTATPRDYLKNINASSTIGNDPREVERRLLRDTYHTFGCKSEEATFRYSLLDGVQDGYLVNPTVIDARSEVTTQLLSEQGFIATFINEEGENHEESYKQREFEKRFFSEATNQLFCKIFLERGLKDPVSKEFGKSIIFTVSQSHAIKITQILNLMADRMYPGKYQSDFAIQVTSVVHDAQQYAINFANNKLSGSGNFNPEYLTSKTRVCVTVGMMTTGYDCTDILNLAMLRPIFSPTDFVQIKGRGTRKHDFTRQLINRQVASEFEGTTKTTFKLFDFFGNYEFFENEFNYDEVLELPAIRTATDNDYKQESLQIKKEYEHLGRDIMASISEEHIGEEGMRIDRRLYEKFGEILKEDPVIVEAVKREHWDLATAYIRDNIFDKPEFFFTLSKLRKAVEADRRVSIQELVEHIFGLTSRFKSRDELLDSEFQNFIRADPPPRRICYPSQEFFQSLCN